MQYLQPYIYQVIRELVEKRKADKKFPYIASRNEVVAHVLSDLKETISELESDGLVSHGVNINGIELYSTKREMDNDALQNLYIR